MSKSVQRQRSQLSPQSQPSAPGGQKGRRVPASSRGSGLLVAIVVAAVAVGVIIWQLARSGAAGDIQGVKAYGGLARTHTQEAVTYAQNPPVGGPHSPSWQNCGIYDQPVQNENAVHSLEHGAAWITYRPDLPADAVVQLRDPVRGRSHMLLSPYTGLPAPVVASA